MLLRHRSELTQPRAHLSYHLYHPVYANHDCQMAIASFLDRMCLVLRASGLWLRYAALQDLIPSFPWIVGCGGAMQGKDGIKFCSVA